ncbi:MAG TPA: hypothetical protein VFB34_11330 [Chloroflexota bacterium]|nr:hypothetical protein [Chloroflexota bacterium]
MNKRRWAVVVAALLVAVVSGLWLGLGTGGTTASASCRPGARSVRVGESLHVTRLPKGMVVTSGSTSDIHGSTVVYSVPRLKGGPYVSFRALDRQGSSGLAPPELTVESVVVEGQPALLAEPPKLIAAESEVGIGYLYWEPAAGVVLTMKSYELAPSAMVWVADSVSYASGRVVQTDAGCR